MTVKAFRVDWYPHAALVDLAKLKPEEIAVLVQIVNLIYAHNGPIDNDPKFISKYCGMGGVKSKKTINSLVHKEHIYITGDGKIAQKRCLTELETVEKRREISSKNGRKGAEERWGCQQKQQDRNGNAIRGAIDSISKSNSQSISLDPIAEQCELETTSSAQNGEVSDYGQYDVESNLSNQGLAAAKEAAPGWDLYSLMKKYNAWINQEGQSIPAYPDKAFPAWCSRFTKGESPA